MVGANMHSWYVMCINDWVENCVALYAWCIENLMFWVMSIDL